MPGNWHVQFLGGRGPETGRAYPTTSRDATGGAGERGSQDALLASWGDRIVFETDRTPV